MTHPRLNLADDRATLRDHAEEVIRGAFPAFSRHQTCKDAARLFACSPDTIERLMNGVTLNPDLMILIYCSGLYEANTKRPSPIRGVLIRLLAAAAP